METLIVKFDNSNTAVKQILNGLRKMGALVIEKPIYNIDILKKIAKGEHDLINGKGKAVNLNDIWK